MKTITNFRWKLSKLYEKDTILQVTITFFLKQRQTRVSSGPIPLPLIKTKLNRNSILNVR